MVCNIPSILPLLEWHVSGSSSLKCKRGSEDQSWWNLEMSTGKSLYETERATKGRSRKYVGIFISTKCIPTTVIRKSRRLSTFDIADRSDFGLVP